MKLIASKKMTYNTRRLVAGDEFDAKEIDAKILIYRKKAKQYTAPVAPQPEPAQTPETIYSSDYIEQLRQNARDIGIDVDNRWGSRRLKIEIERKGGEANG